MKTLLAALCLTGLLVAQDAKPGPKHVTADELKELLEKEKGKFQFLDVREPAEIEAMGSIKGYRNIPVGQLEARLSELTKDKPVITACARGARAERARVILEKAGFTVLASCGLNEWKAKGYPLEK
jgi:rhodanese-related sulfurtransferase